MIMESTGTLTVLTGGPGHHSSSDFCQRCLVSRTASRRHSMLVVLGRFEYLVFSLFYNRTDEGWMDV